MWSQHKTLFQNHTHRSTVSRLTESSGVKEASLKKQLRKQLAYLEKQSDDERIANLQLQVF